MEPKLAEKHPENTVYDPTRTQYGSLLMVIVNQGLF